MTNENMVYRALIENPDSSNNKLQSLTGLSVQQIYTALHHLDIKNRLVKREVLVPRGVGVRKTFYYTVVENNRGPWHSFCFCPRQMEA